jgi:hypothetical protein
VQDEAMKRHIEAALTATGGCIENRRGAAAVLKINRKQVYRWQYSAALAREDQQPKQFGRYRFLQRSSTAMYTPDSTMVTINQLGEPANNAKIRLVTTPIAYPTAGPAVPTFAASFHSLSKSTRSRRPVDASPAHAASICLG